MRTIFSEDFKFVEGNDKPDTALVNSTAYPASGSYIDVSGYEEVNVIVKLGTLADTVAFTLKQTDATNGSTLDTISSTLAKHTVATSDDGELVTFYVETAKLATNHHFLTCYVTGVSGSDYADILFVLGGTRHMPVTQATALLPSASQHIFAG